MTEKADKSSPLEKVRVCALKFSGGTQTLVPSPGHQQPLAHPGSRRHTHTNLQPEELVQGACVRHCLGICQESEVGAKLEKYCLFHH